MSDDIREQPRSSKWPKWYALVALSGFGLMLILLGMMITAELLDARDFLYATADIVGPVLGILLLFTILWSSWVCPIFDAREKNPNWTYEPKRRRRSLIVAIWAIPVAIAGVTLISIIAIIRQHLQGYETWREDWYYVIVSTVITCVIAMIATFITLNVCRAFRQTTAARNICFDCGYDLRMTTSGQCPECGAEIPVSAAAVPSDAESSRSNEAEV